MKNIFKSKKSIWALINAIVFIILSVILYLRQGSFESPLSSSRLDVVQDDSETPGQSVQTIETTTTSVAVVVRVIDGDTVELSTGARVRYIGINTPETVDPRKSVECFGKESSAYNKQLVLGQEVRLEKDVSDTDRYHRLLRYVYLEDGTFLNLKLIEDGYADAATYPPDTKYSEQFVTAAKVARETGKGLWGKCK